MKSGKVLIGWASRDITPAKKVSLLGQFHVRISEKVNDPLTTTALALESEDRREQSVIVSLDAVFVSDLFMKQCREKLKSKLPDFDPEKLLISATHTHTAPGQRMTFFLDPPGLGADVMTAEEYTDFLSTKITEAVVEAWNSRKPGAVSWGRGHAVVGFNRRVSYFDGTTVMYGKTDKPEFSHIEGYEDHGVDLLFTYDVARKLTGMIVNVPCPSQCTEGASFVSADYWHETRCEIRKRHGGKLFILPQCAAAGDQSPRTMVNRLADARMLKLKGYGEEYNQARRQDIADKIAAAVDEVLPLAAKDIRDQAVFGHRISKIDLPLRTATDADFEDAKKQVAEWSEKLIELKDHEPSSAEYSSAFKYRNFNQEVVDMYEAQKKGKQFLPVELHTLRLGDIAFCSNRFEYFLDYGLRIKARSKAIQTFMIQLAGNGTYLPTERAMKGGGYGAYIASTPIGPDGGQMIVEECLRNMDELFA
ncbi:MAG: hypothetical protein NT118_08540 [Lentisphaerae bacterium]|nr:hypothetical protein [Lentisphaerota bacterium]